MKPGGKHRTRLPPFQRYSHTCVLWVIFGWPCTCNVLYLTIGHALYQFSMLLNIIWLCLNVPDTMPDLLPENRIDLNAINIDEVYVLKVENPESSIVRCVVHISHMRRTWFGGVFSRSISLVANIGSCRQSSIIIAVSLVSNFHALRTIRASI